MSYPSKPEATYERALHGRIELDLLRIRAKQTDDGKLSNRGAAICMHAASDEIERRDREMAALRSALKECLEVAEKFEDIEHWEDCDAASSDEDNEGDDPSCVCSRGAVRKVIVIARNALGGGAK